MKSNSKLVYADMLHWEANKAGGSQAGPVKGAKGQKVIWCEMQGSWCQYVSLLFSDEELLDSVIWHLAAYNELDKGRVPTRSRAVASSI